MARTWPDPVRQVLDALVGDLDARERMLDTAAAPRIGPAQRLAEHSRLALEQLDAEVLLEVSDAAVHPRLELQALLLGIVAMGRVGVEPDAVAELAAEHLPARHAPRLPGQVHARHLDPAHAAGLPSVAAELLDLPKDLVDVAGVLAEDAALQHQRVRLVRAVAHLAPADDALIGVDANERAHHRRADDDGERGDR